MLQISEGIGQGRVTANLADWAVPDREGGCIDYWCQVCYTTSSFTESCLQKVILRNLSVLRDFMDTSKCLTSLYYLLPTQDKPSWCRSQMKRVCHWFMICWSKKAFAWVVQQPLTLAVSYFTPTSTVLACILHLINSYVIWLCIVWNQALDLWMLSI